MSSARKITPSNGGLLNKAWRYVPACQTDIRVTFAMARLGVFGAAVRTPVTTGGAL